MSATQPPNSSDNITPAAQDMNEDANPVSAVQAVAALHLLSEAAVAPAEILENYSTTRQDDAFAEEGDVDCQNYLHLSIMVVQKRCLPSQTLPFVSSLRSWTNSMILCWKMGGRPRKEEKCKPKDILVMTLTTLKDGRSWDWLRRMFNMKGITFERLLTQFMDKIADQVYKIVWKTWRMFQRLREQGF